MLPPNPLAPTGTKLHPVELGARRLASAAQTVAVCIALDYLGLKFLGLQPFEVTLALHMLVGQAALLWIVFRQGYFFVPGPAGAKRRVPKSLVLLLFFGPGVLAATTVGLAAFGQVPSIVLQLIDALPVAYGLLFVLACVAFAIHRRRLPPHADSAADL